MNPARLALLGSGNGSHLKTIHDLTDEGLRLELVLSDKADAYILSRAESLDIPHYHVPADKNREQSDAKIHELLQHYQIDYVILAGYMKKLSSWLCEQWKNRIFNIHPSLLPDYANMQNKDIFQAVIDDEQIITGCTLHRVEPEVDGGEILEQSQCLINSGDDAESIKAKIFELERHLLTRFIKQLKRDHARN